MELVLFSLVLRSIELCLVTDVFCVVPQVCLENLTHTQSHRDKVFTWFPKICSLRSVYSQLFVFLSQEFAHSWLPPEEPHGSHSISNCLLLYSLLYPRHEYPIYRQKRALFLTHAWRLFLPAINLKHAKNQIQSYPPVKFEGWSLSHLGGFPTFWLYNH